MKRPFSFRSLQRWSSPGKCRARKVRTRTLELERLEDRATPAVLTVGPNQMYALPSQAAAAAHDGDTVDIYSNGNYTGDTTLWTQNNLTIEGVGGRAHIDITGHIAYGDKGIWVLDGSNTTVQNMELSGAHDLQGNTGKNWAGVRLEGNTLTLINDYFHNDDDGILTGATNTNLGPTSNILIQGCEFANNGYGDGFSHNMYIGQVTAFTLENSYSHDCNQGHLVKSRALTNYILYNRLEDGSAATSTASYELDLPQGGTSYVIGNLIEQGPNSANSTILTYSEESTKNADQSLYLINNTIVNDRSAGGIFVRLPYASSSATLENNIFAGPGTVVSGSGSTTQITNLVSNNPGFVNQAGYDYHLTSSSPAINAGTAPGTVNGYDLTPVYEYLDPLSLQPRPADGPIDIGAYEFVLATHFGISAPSSGTTGSALSFTVTALDDSGNTATGYSGMVHFTSSDSMASLPGNSTLTNGTGTFSATLNTSGNQTISATDTVTSSLTGTSNVIAMRGLVVTSFTPTPTGFTVTLSKAFVNSSSSPLNLYDAASAGYGAADVTLVGSGTIGRVKGSLVIDPSNTSFTFIKTGGPVGGGSTGLLAAGTYTATLVSGPLAFRDTAKVPLDGNNDGVNGDSYVTTFTVTTSSAVTVTVPDFARGPDSVDGINVPNNAAGNGIPVALSTGAGVTDGTFVLNYNANLLTITGGTVNPLLTGATFTVTTFGSGPAAQATIVFHSPTALAAGAVRLGGLNATVPSNAPYKSKELLHWSSLSLNGGAIATTADDGVHAVAFLGDTTGDGTYTSADSVLIARVASAADSGFAAYPVLDPVLVGDLNGDGRVTATDGGLLNSYLAGTPVLQVPPFPGPPTNNPPGPDPMLSIPGGLRVGPDGTLTVPVLIDDPHPEGSRGLTQAVLALTYDPTVFTVSPADVRLGAVPAAGTGWALQAVVDTATGQIGITLFSATPLATSVGGSLVTITFRLRQGAHAGAAPVRLEPAVNPTGRGTLWTALDDDQGPLALHLAPADAADPGSEGELLLSAVSGGGKAPQDRVFIAPGPSPLADLARDLLIAREPVLPVSPESLARPRASECIALRPLLDQAFADLAGRALDRNGLTDEADKRASRPRRVPRTAPHGPDALEVGAGDTWEGLRGQARSAPAISE
jgi:hypothetical protein